MGLTERHWFENEDVPENYEWGLEDAVHNSRTNKKADILQKLWNALYAEENKLENKYIGTPEHDNWFLVYRPWLQDGFGIAIKVLSEILMPEPPKEETK